MKTLHIIGTLTSTRPESVTDLTYRHIYNAVTKNSLYGIVFSADWKQGALTLNNHTPDVTPDECPSAIEFICRLNNLINEQGIAELGLKGKISVMVPGMNPVVFRLAVDEGKVLYRQATLQWHEPVSVF